MKKIYYLILLVSLMFFGCDSTDNSENQKIAELNEKITVLTKEKMMLNQEIAEVAYEVNQTGFNCGVNIGHNSIMFTCVFV